MKSGDDDLEQVAGVFEGEVLIGKYRVDRLLGVGGMGVVVAARHLQLDTIVAIKILLPKMLANPEAIARFAREARAAIQMSSEHVARVFDVGTLSNGAPYMVMELLDGVDLRMILERQGPVAVEEAVDFVLQACEAVAEAHDLGIVHRDLTPANLFCITRPDGRRVIKVLDFGISKVTGPGWSTPDEPLTVAAAVMGTPSYMSPEQLEAPDTVDMRSDIWSMGVILYELLTGKAPFEGSTLPQVSVRIALRPPLPIQQLRPNIPPGLVEVIAVCLEKDRDKRYRNVADLATALLSFGSRRARISVDRIVETADAASTASTASAASAASAAGTASPTTRRSRPTRRGLVVAALVLGVTLIVGGRLLPQVLHDGSPPARLGTTAAGTETPTSSLRTIDIRPLPSARSSMAGVRVADALRPPSSTRAGFVGSEMSRKLAIEDTSRPGERVAGPRHRSRSAAPSKLTLAQAARPSSDDDRRTPATSRCDPPFDLDNLGHKHFKSECWGGSPAASVGRARSDATCAPNYDLDEQGRKHFKPECFLKSTP
jgi:serine/threonine protein kinase